MSENNNDNQNDKKVENISISNNEENENIDNNENNYLTKSKEFLENNLYQSDNGHYNKIEDELDNNLINYEINNEDEIYQNNINIDSTKFKNELSQKNNEINDEDININNEKDIYNNDEENNNIEIGEENEQKDENELSLITLDSISFCQCCKSQFNNLENLPYLFKCGHFFCIKCINQYFKDETGIICPSDGLIAKSIKELKLLKNLIINNDNEECSNINISNKNNNLDNNNEEKKIQEDNKDTNIKYCKKHKDQKLTHINCEDNKLICIYCAFELLKNNQKYEIKEIKEKIEEYKINIDTILEESKNGLEKIKPFFNKIKKIKDDENKKIELFYKQLIEFLNRKQKQQKETLNKIYDNIFKELEKNTNLFNEIIERGSNLINQFKKNNYIITDIITNYNNLYNLFSSKNNVDRFEYIIFKHDNEKEVLNYLNNINDIEIKNEFLNYEFKDNRNINNSNKINKNDLYNDINKYNCMNNNNLGVNLDKYNFFQSGNTMKQLSTTNNFANNNSNNNYLNDIKYNTFYLKNGYNQNMPIHSSYLFHRNSIKKDSILKNKFYNTFKSNNY